MSTHADTGRAAIRQCPICGPAGGLIRCPDCHSPGPDPFAARRRILATIATEAPGQDVSGVFVIDDALRIDFVSGAALLIGADGTLSWEAAGRGDPEPCPNAYCRGGWVERGDNESGGAPAMRCQVCNAYGSRG